MNLGHLALICAQTSMLSLSLAPGGQRDARVPLVHLGLLVPRVTWVTMASKERKARLAPSGLAELLVFQAIRRRDPEGTTGLLGLSVAPASPAAPAEPDCRE